jgi:hypothetical protein
VVDRAVAECWQCRLRTKGKRPLRRWGPPCRRRRTWPAGVSRPLFLPAAARNCANRTVVPGAHGATTETAPAVGVQVGRAASGETTITERSESHTSRATHRLLTAEGGAAWCRSCTSKRAHAAASRFISLVIKAPLTTSADNSENTLVSCSTLASKSMLLSATQQKACGTYTLVARELLVYLRLASSVLQASCRLALCSHISQSCFAS